MLSNEKIQELKKGLAKKNLRLSEVFKALSEPNRCKIFWIFATEDSVSVSNTAELLGISLPLASLHLKTLLQNGLLKKEKRGQRVYYELNPIQPVKTLLKILK